MTLSILLAFVSGVFAAVLALYLSDRIHAPEVDQNPSFGGMGKSEKEEME